MRTNLEHFEAQKQKTKITIIISFANSLLKELPDYCQSNLLSCNQMFS